MEGGEMSGTPISDSTPHNVAELGMLCRRIERQLNAANSIIRQQQLLDEENLRLQERIKRLEEAGDRLSDCADQIGWTSCESPQWIKKAENAVKEWRKAKEAKL
jgi:cell division septum initiation protein DivIVA